MSHLTWRDKYDILMLLLGCYYIFRADNWGGWRRAICGVTLIIVAFIPWSW